MVTGVLFDIMENEDTQPQEAPPQPQKDKEPEVNAPGKPVKLPDPSGKFNVPGL